MSSELISGAVRLGLAFRTWNRAWGPTVGQAKTCGSPGLASTLPLLGIHTTLQTSLPLPGTVPA